MMTTATNGGNGRKRVFKGDNRDAHFILGTKPGLGGRNARAVRRLVSRRRSPVPCAAATQDLPKKTRAPGLGVEPGDLVIEILICASGGTGHPCKERLEQFHAIRPPGPGPQTAELPLTEMVGRVNAPFSEFDELRRRKPGLLEEGEDVRRRSFRQEHNIVRLTEELR